MKKHFQKCALSALIAALCAVSAFGSGASTVITLSYLNGSYTSQLTAAFVRALSGLDSVYESALSKLEQGPAAPVWTATDTFQAVYPLAGETVTLGAGSGLVWYAGAGAADQMLLDVTAGSELAAGGALTAGHRYLAECETTVTAAAESSCAAEGLWRTNATGKAPPEPPFLDVPLNEWYCEPVRYVVERQLFNGTGDNRFTPMGTMDRSMLVTVLYRLAGQPPVSGNSPFTDVKAGAWYHDAVLWANQTGIAAGAGSPTTFRPDTPVTREQIALMFYRFAVYYGYDAAARADLSGYSDYESINDYAAEAFQWCVGAGLFQGSAGRLNPGSSAMRCEVAILFQRLDKLISG